MLLWQDMPLQWGYARSVRKQAVRQAFEMVDLLGHHPSIVHWCGHNEPLALDVGPEQKSVDLKRKYFLLQEAPTWNKSVLDFGIHRALTRADPSRPITAHSGVLPGPTSGGTDSHLYFGWYHGRERELPKLLRRLPRLGRFVSEFGAQAIPVDDSFINARAWPTLAWDELARDRSMNVAMFDRNVAPSAFDSYVDWKAATQRHQAEVVGRQIEELRRIKYQPNGGFAMFHLADPLDYPAVTFSVLGHDRQAKPGYDAIVDACRPLIVTVDRPPAVVSVGDAITLDVHVVSDVRHVLKGAVVTAHLTWPGGEDRWAWTGDLAADRVTRIGAIDVVVARPAPSLVGREGGGLVLDLTVEHPEHTATNRYVSAFG
jgi:beta-mannosidase